MHDSLSMILTEGSGGLLDYACKLDRIEVNNHNKIEKHDVPLLKKMNKNPCPLYLEKRTLRHFTCYVVTRREHEGKRYRKSYYKNISIELIHMYYIANMYMPESLELNWVSSFQ